MTTAHGIYEYSGAEEGAPGPDWTALLTDSIEDALVQVDADIAGIPTQTDSGWVPITTFGAGWAGTANHTPRVRRVGDRVELAGALTRSGTSGAPTNLLTIPEGFRLAGGYGNYFIGTVTTSAAQACELFLFVGDHRIQIPYGIIGSGVVVPLNGSWFVN